MSGNPQQTVREAWQAWDAVEYGASEVEVKITSNAFKAAFIAAAQELDGMSYDDAVEFERQGDYKATLERWRTEYGA